MNRKALLFALVVSLIGTALLFVYMRRFEEERSGGEPVRVLATVRPLKGGELISDDILGVVVIPRAYVEKRAVLESEKSKVVGLRVGHTLQAQQTLLWTDLAIALEERRSLSSLVQPGKRAVTVRAKSGDDKGFALIRPGDRIDVITTVKKAATKPSEKDETSSVVLLQNILVLAVGADTGSDPTATAQGAGQRGELVLSLSLNVQESQLIALAQTTGGVLSVALRNPDDVVTLQNPVELDLSSLSDGEKRARVQSAGARPAGPIQLGSKGNQ